MWNEENEPGKWKKSRDEEEECREGPKRRYDGRCHEEKQQGEERGGEVECREVPMRMDVAGWAE